ncbi:hypothetical protein SEA_NEFERTHENA_22 [Microbacterium phage Neferthena]|uniref:Uncharacterized protein n=1 Tax=Microbacterium phage Neferthena TaxID=2301539 RepID=A0A385D3K8_9CAUD|nr:hypothetical protein HOT92_gp22 [Microbacterium phage Neferthena]AXQ52886.1 hypothetical protein SEA_NEFERTHENA_22 [Microbacterium phage Neferthena]
MKYTIEIEVDYNEAADPAGLTSLIQQKLSDAFMSTLGVIGFRVEGFSPAEEEVV